MPRQALEAGGYFHESTNVGVGLTVEDAERAVQKAIEARQREAEERVRAKHAAAMEAWAKLKEAASANAAATAGKDADDFLDWFRETLDRLGAQQSEPGDPKALEYFGLTLAASVDDVRRAYRSRALKAHPDAGGNGTKFRELQNKFDSALRYVVAGH